MLVWTEETVDADAGASGGEVERVELRVELGGEGIGFELAVGAREDDPTFVKRSEEVFL